MSILRDVINAVETFDQSVEKQVSRARTDPAAGKSILRRWRETAAAVPTTTTPTGLRLPRLALPKLDEPGAVARFLHGEGLPGEFPFVNGTYPNMYLAAADGSPPAEEPTRLFAGLGLADDTNKRFRYLGAHQRSIRLSTAFDGPTLYGVDSDADGALGKVGEGGVAVDTVEDMRRLYAGFDL